MSDFHSLLNEQIGHEFSAAQQYIAIAVWYDQQTLPRLAAHFYQQALEERNHGMMIVQYLMDTDRKVVVAGRGGAAQRVREHLRAGRGGARAGEAGDGADQRASPPRRAPRTTSRASSSCSGS